MARLSTKVKLVRKAQFRKGNSDSSLLADSSERLQELQ